MGLLARLLIIGVLLAAAPFSLAAQDDTVWIWWEHTYLKDSVQRTRADLDGLIKLHEQWLLNPTTGRQLKLFPSNLGQADLTGARLQRSDLLGVYLGYANLSWADLSRAKFVKINLEHASLHNANLSGAELRDCNLTDADLFRAHLEGVKLTGSNLSMVRYEEIDSLPHIPGIASVHGLRTLSYDVSPTSLVDLRNAFEKAGYKQQERDIICALRRHGFNPVGTLFFDWTSEYGSNPYRPWIIFGGIWFLWGVLYYLSMITGWKGGVRLIEYAAMSSGSRTCTGSYIIYRKNGYIRQMPNGMFHCCVWFRLIWWAGYFSLLSAFNIGFRDVNFGRWLKLLTRRKFDLEAFGWVRVISGFQALISVYLIALWILSFAGTPFK